MFNLKELEFIIESLKWAEQSYTEKIHRKHYIEVPDYYENNYLPKLKEFSNAVSKLQALKTNLKGVKDES